ncbi:MAG: T9SS type A sorting domain-containing protein [Bacteroidia bacterium]|nr:T9SS type A sorting domain-containing protein [Bacteroidia bacterium]
MKLKLSVVAIILISISIHCLEAQDRTNVTGNVATGPGGSVSYTVGLIDYITCTGPGEVVTEGVQQPYEIFLTWVREGEVASSIQVYPNPVEEIVVVEVGNNSRREAMRYALYDLHGKYLGGAGLGGSRTVISMAGLARASYLLKITERDLEVKVFKLVKN